MVCADRFSTELPGSEFHFTPEDQILSYRAFRNVAPLILGSAKRLPVSKFCVLLHEKYLPVLELVQSVGAGFSVRMSDSIPAFETLKLRHFCAKIGWCGNCVLPLELSSNQQVL